jgi:hypothetical protein
MDKLLNQCVSRQRQTAPDKLVTEAVEPLYVKTAPDKLVTEEDITTTPSGSTVTATTRAESDFATSFAEGYNIGRTLGAIKAKKQRDEDGHGVVVFTAPLRRYADVESGPALEDKRTNWGSDPLRPEATPQSLPRRY